jgi:hypothetical protein
MFIHEDNAIVLAPAQSDEASGRQVARARRAFTLLNDDRGKHWLHPQGRQLQDNLSGAKEKSLSGMQLFWCGWFELGGTP